MNFFKIILFKITNWYAKASEDYNEMQVRKAIQDPIPERSQGKQIMRGVRKEKREAKKEATKRKRESEKA